ncbi:MAG: ATP-binding protein [Bacteroidota bacterium]
MVTQNRLDDLKAFPIFKTVPDKQLEWLASELTITTIAEGAFLFEKDSPIDHLIVVFEGDFELYFQKQGGRKAFGTIKTQSVTGLLPFSRAKTATAFARSNSESVVGKLDREKLKELTSRFYELTAVLVQEMNNRIRNITQIEVQNEKLIALGKLSAGLAHELNNPASAMVRSAVLLQQHLMGLPSDFKKVMNIKSDDATIDQINGFMYQKLEERPVSLSMMEKADQEDDLYDWFSNCSLEDTDDLVPLLVEYQFSTDDLLHVKSMLREEDFNPVLKWIVQNMTTHKTVKDIEEASSRIGKLIKSVKTYSYMDQSLDFQELDLHLGLQSTLDVLNHKLGKVGHTVITDFKETLPKIKGLPGELNQVWTNLIDNAIDALPKEGGRLEIVTDCSRDFVYVTIKDNGHGISEEDLNRVFEPFFTTKAIGKGTGLGLDMALKIVEQHHGRIKVDSKPGATIFEVCLPINHKPK